MGAWRCSKVRLFLQFGMLKSFATFREGLIEANREGLTSSLGYLALHLAGVSWGSDLLFLASTPDHLFTSAGLLVVWLVSETRMQTTIAPLRAGLMWGALAYSSTLFPPASRRLVRCPTRWQRNVAKWHGAKILIYSDVPHAG